MGSQEALCFGTTMFFVYFLVQSHILLPTKQNYLTIITKRNYLTTNTKRNYLTTNTKRNYLTTNTKNRENPTDAEIWTNRRAHRHSLWTGWAFLMKAHSGNLAKGTLRYVAFSRVTIIPPLKYDITKNVSAFLTGHGVCSLGNKGFFPA